MNLTKKVLKKIFLSLLIITVSVTLFAQTNAMIKGIVSYNTDSTTFKSTINSTQSIYGNIGGLYYNKQSSKWRIFSDSVWYDLPISTPEPPFITNAVTTDTDSIIIASAILRPNGSSTGSGPIDWEILNTDTDHLPLFFKDSITFSSNNLVLHFPPISKVVSFVVVPDETLASKGIFCGASVGVATATISCYINAGVYGGYIRGTGTGSFFTRVGNLSTFDMIFDDAGKFRFNMPLIYGGNLSQNSIFQQAATAHYVGSNDYRLVRTIGGLGAYNFGYEIWDNATGAKILTNSTSDVVEILTQTPITSSLNMGANNSGGYPGANIFTASSNLWVFAVFKL